VHIMASLTLTRRFNQRGQAIIELALTLPLLLAVVFGIIDFGFMFQRYESVTNAAREGARLGILQSSAGYTATEAQNRAISYLQASGANGPVRTSCGGPLVRDSMCAQMTTQPVTIIGSTPAKTVEQVTMIVEYDHEHSFVGPIMNLFGSGLGSIRLRSTSIMRKE
jgi:Flp pilus assembly protein TadG